MHPKFKVFTSISGRGHGHGQPSNAVKNEPRTFLSFNISLVTRTFVNGCGKAHSLWSLPGIPLTKRNLATCSLKRYGTVTKWCGVTGLLRTQDSQPLGNSMPWMPCFVNDLWYELDPKFHHFSLRQKDHFSMSWTWNHVFLHTSQVTNKGFRQMCLNQIQQRIHIHLV